jgi:Domain of unknown function (DUF4124)
MFCQRIGFLQRKHPIIWVALSFSLWLSAAHSTNIYRYEDEAGRTVYTNVPPKGKEGKDKKVRLVTEPISIIPGGYTERNAGIILPSPEHRSGSRHLGSSEPSSSEDHLEGLPTRIDTTVQQGRDATRRSILLNELNTERQALNEAQKQIETAPPAASPGVGALGNGKTGTGLKLPGLSTLQQSIESHERNIQALQKELGIK